MNKESGSHLSRETSSVPKMETPQNSSTDGIMLPTVVISAGDKVRFIVISKLYSKSKIETQSDPDFWKKTVD